MTSKVLSQIPLSQRLELLRTEMRSSLIDGLIVPTSDVHGSEYIADCDKRREFISGFAGSCGTAFITQKEALLWVDSRYTLQAQLTVDKQFWSVFLLSKSFETSICEWLVENYFSESEQSQVVVPKDNEMVEQNRLFKLCVNGDTIFHNGWSNISSELKTWKDFVEFVTIDEDIVDRVWTDRPSRPNLSLSIVPPSFSGELWSDKISRLCALARKKNCTALVVTALDEIAWMFNLRGNDIAYNPVFFSNAMIFADEECVHFYMDDYKLRSTPGLFDHLTVPRVKCHLHDYIHLPRDLIKLVNSLQERGSSNKLIWVSPKTAESVVKLIPDKFLYLDASPIMKCKAVKTTNEIAGIKEAHIRDAVALCRFFLQLEIELDQQYLNEKMAADILDKLRMEETDCIGLSFDTISAVGSNGAIVHYKPSCDPATPSKQITKNELYLVDSGGQYQFLGTTDVTRTLHFGSPTQQERFFYTLVLKAHIGLAHAIFPNLTSADQLDSLCRSQMWNVGRIYGHGTGHGVGAFLNVHEDPFFSSKFPLQENIVITIEPGYYEANAFGIRIENVYQIVKASNTKLNDDSDSNLEFLTFQPITCVPLQSNLIDKEMLSQSEIKWINDYQKFCLDTLTPVLEKRQLIDVLNWLQVNTQTLK